MNFPALVTEIERCILNPVKIKLPVKEKIMLTKTKTEIYDKCEQHMITQEQAINNKIMIAHKHKVLNIIREFALEFYKELYKEIREFKIQVSKESELDTASETMRTAIGYNKRCDEVDNVLQKYFGDRLHELHKE